MGRGSCGAHSSCLPDSLAVSARTYRFPDIGKQFTRFLYNTSGVHTFGCIYVCRVQILGGGVKCTRGVRGLGVIDVLLHIFVRQFVMCTTDEYCSECLMNGELSAKI